MARETHAFGPKSKKYCHLHNCKQLPIKLRTDVEFNILKKRNNKILKYKKYLLSRYKNFNFQ